jgi:hypothetical protein
MVSDEARRPAAEVGAERETGLAGGGEEGGTQAEFKGEGGLRRKRKTKLRAVMTCGIALQRGVG